MYHILEAMTRWIAPVLSFTADEIWAVMPKPKGEERAASVMLCSWYDGLFPMDEDSQQGTAFWATVLEAKTAVNKRIEEERNAGKIKGSLSAEVSLYCEGELYQVLKSLGEELRFVLITSEATVGELSEAENALPSEMDGLLIDVRATQHKKCERCWHHREDVGQHEEHDDLCGRCIENVDGAGEQRQFA
jgi:isoleucyl-tRNA synthetase